MKPSTAAWLRLHIRSDIRRLRVHARELCALSPAFKHEWEGDGIYEWHGNWYAINVHTEDPVAFPSDEETKPTT